MADFDGDDSPEGPVSDVRTAEMRSSDVHTASTLSGSAVSNDPKLAGLMALLTEARSAPLPAPSAEGSEGQRQEGQRQQIAALAKSIRSVPALQARLTWRRRALWAGLSSLAVAAAAALFVALPYGEDAAPGVALNNAAPQVLSLRQVVGKVIATHADGNDVVLRPDMGLQGGDQVSTTAEAFASLEFTAGTRVDLSSATTMKVVEAQELELRVGRVDINVPKVADGEARRLAVNTPNATVVVRGTIFSVEVEAADTSAVTRVGVTRGAVSVFYAGREHTVRAGEFWASDKPLEKGTSSSVGGGSVEAPLERSAPAVEAPAVLKAPRAAPPSFRDNSESEEAAESETVSSSLSQQNRLFSRGLRARAQGDDARAAYWFEQLTSRFPDSPLAEAAIRERDAAVQRSQAQ